MLSTTINTTLSPSCISQFRKRLLRMWLYTLSTVLSLKPSGLPFPRTEFVATSGATRWLWFSTLPSPSLTLRFTASSKGFIFGMLCKGPGCSPLPQMFSWIFPLQVSWWKIRSRLDGKSHRQEKRFLTFNADRNDGMIPGLEPFSEYLLTVLAFNSKGPGPESNTYKFQTPEGGKWARGRETVVNVPNSIFSLLQLCVVC